MSFKVEGTEREGSRRRGTYPGAAFASMRVHVLAGLLIANDLGEVVVFASVTSGVDLNGRFGGSAVGCR